MAGIGISKGILASWGLGSSGRTGGIFEGIGGGLFLRTSLNSTPSRCLDMRSFDRDLLFRSSRERDLFLFRSRSLPRSRSRLSFRLADLDLLLCLCLLSYFPSYLLFFLSFFWDARFFERREPLLLTDSEATLVRWFRSLSKCVYTFEVMSFPVVVSVGSDYFDGYPFGYVYGGTVSWWDGCELSMLTI